MENYLIDFRKKPAYKEIDSLIPSNLCPFLFYNLTPYIFTLAKGGWFNWVKWDKNNLFRKPINKDDFKRNDINRLYPNEVLVRCPNPYVTVVAGVGLWLQDKIKIRILHSSYLCVNGHKPSDEIVIDITNASKNTLDLNNLFPEILALSLAGRLPRTNNGFCKIGTEITVEIFKIIFPCRYHKKNNKFKSDFLLDRFCPHVFNAIYPYILAKMYNARIDEILKIKHPRSEGCMTFTLKKVYKIKSEFVRRYLNLSKRLFERIFYPVDLLDYRLEINILENGSTECTLKTGRRYFVNLSNENFLCPASFHALYPYLLLATLSYRMRWNTYNTVNLLPCPDCIGAVYSLNKKGDTH